MYSQFTLQRASSSIERLRFSQGLGCFSLNARNQFVASGNIVDEADDLASGPDLDRHSQLTSGSNDQIETNEANEEKGQKEQKKEKKLTYTKIWITVNKHLPTTLPAHKRCNLLELARLTLLLNARGFQRDFILEQTRGVLPPTHHKRGIRFLCFHNRFLDIVMNRRLDRAHKPRAHIDSFGPQRQRRRQTLSVRKPARCNKGDIDLLPRTAQEDEIREVVLAHVARALEAVDGQEIHAQSLRGFCVADGGAFVEDDDVGLFQLLDYGARTVAGCFDDFDTFFNHDAGVGGVVGGYKGWEEGYVDSEGSVGECSGFADFLSQVFGGRLRECC